MGNADSVPVISQTKSLVQAISGDTDGALRTQENFSRQCPVISQTRSLVEVSMGDSEAALETQKQFGQGMSDLADSLPVVGQIKGGIHYACGDREGGDRAMMGAMLNLLPFGTGLQMPFIVTMGNLSPKETRATIRKVVEHVYEEGDEGKRMEMIGKLENRLAELKTEVENVKPVITKYIKVTYSEEQNVLLTRHSHLSDTAEIEKTIREVLVTFPYVDLLVKNIAIVVLAALNNAKESSEILRWQQHKLFERVGNKVVGMEAHFKVKMLEEDKGGIRLHKEAVVLIAYKCLAHIMEGHEANADYSL